MTKPGVPSVGEAVGAMADALRKLAARKCVWCNGNRPWPSDAPPGGCAHDIARAALRSFEEARRVPLRENQAFADSLFNSGVEVSRLLLDAVERALFGDAK